MKNKNIKKVLSVGVASALVLSGFAPSFAAVTDYVTQDAEGNTYQYKYDDLKQSYQNKVLGVGGDELYKHYENKTLKALNDSKNSYVDYNDVKSAYQTAVLEGKNFDVNAYTESDNAVKATMPATVKGISVDNGAIKETVINVEQGLNIKSVSAITSTKLQLNLSEAVDQASAANFKIPGLTVTSATLDSTKKVVTLIVTGTQANKEYQVTATGLKVNAVVKPDLVKKFTMPDVSAIYNPKVTFAGDIKVLKADGASKVLTTFTLADAQGNPVTDAQDVEVSFATTFGNFGQQRVTLQKGVATVMLNSEFLTEAREADIKAQVVEAADKKLIGLKAETKLLMDPNPNTSGENTVGASMTDAEANQADRVIVYFNENVNVDDYLVSKARPGFTVGQIDTDKAIVQVKKSVKNDGSAGSAVVVKGLMPVDGNSKALQVLLDVEAGAGNALVDNHNVYVSFEDKTKSVPVKRDKVFKLTDARKPAMLSVAPEGLKKLTLVFSESVEGSSATTLKNWTIDGKSIDSAKSTRWGTAANKATVTVGQFSTKDKTDKRHVVTIELGKDALGKQIYFPAGAHSVTASNVKDWAGTSDNSNVMNTQTLDFNIAADNALPSASVEVQSPEQYVITFDKDILETDAQLAAKLKMERYNTITGWGAYAASFATASNVGNGTLDFVVTNISESGSNNKFLVEADMDWTKVYSTSSTTKNYFNDNFRIKLPKDSVTAGVNGKKNIENILTLDASMRTPDVVSPKIASMKLNEAETAYEVTMDEPVKLQIAGPTVANNEGKTLAEGQADLTFTTAEFIKKDNSKTIKGTVGSSFVDKEDKVIEVTPAADLDPGEWQLVVRSISDDIGNTAASATHDFNVKGESVSSDFRIVWAQASEDKEYRSTANSNDGDYIFVKFNKEISTVGDFKNALKNSNYTFNGANLPSTAHIEADIKNYDDFDAKTDSVTIYLPEDALQSSNILNVSSLLESKTAGDKLANGGEYVLPVNREVATVNSQADIDAALKNPSVYTIKLGSAVTGNIVADRMVDIDLDGNNLTGNVSITTNQVGVYSINSTAGAASISGTYTINTPNADAVLGANVTVSGLTTIEDINGSTFTNNGTINGLTITDGNGAGIDNQGTISGTVTISPVNASAPVVLKGSGAFGTVNVTTAGAKVEVDSTATVTTLNVNAANVAVTGEGVITNIAGSDAASVAAAKKTAAINKIEKIAKNGDASGITEQDIKDAGVTVDDVKTANVSVYQAEIAAADDDALDTTAEIQAMVTSANGDVDLVAAEKAKYETAATVANTVVVGDKITNTVIKLKASQTADSNVVSAAKTPTDGTYIKIDSDGDFALKALATNGGGDKDENVTFELAKGFAKDTVTVTVTVKEQG